MFSTLRNAWKVPELRKKMLFTLLILLIYRLGNVVPVPFIDVTQLNMYFSVYLENTILGLYNAMSGSAFSQASIFALGIQPYINASIIIELLCVAIPALERLQKEGGEEGRKMINKITRYTTVGLGLLMGFAYFIMISRGAQGISILSRKDFLAGLVIVLSFAAGASLVMWMGEQITEFGIGNGISMILFANIVSGLPSMAGVLFGGTFPWWASVILTVAILALVVFIVFITDSERRIPVQYAKRVVGRKIYGGQNTHLPIKVSMSGVLPVIFAQSIVSLPATICAFIGKTDSWVYKNIFDAKTAVYAVFYFILIIAFSYFYASVQYNPVEISNNLKQNGGFIPGFRPGKPTSDFIAKVIKKIVLFGAIYLAIVALLPIIAGDIFPAVDNLAIGGTSIIIVVGVALETVNALEAQMLMRHYKGFLG
ncbi:MAG: preprotein translocase subunit SecY [Oscillospiraceae bacterium]|nr:preprotein translocase subunit SecY [Oscillospiraceae bacterium]